MSAKYTYEFDIHKKKLVSDCSIHPTDIYQSDSPWLWARNNKYPNVSIDTAKIGKWMLFLPKDAVNTIWNEIKMAVKSGELWDSKVSTSNAEITHAIIIYTKDYTDVNDVIKVLDYLESSGIKSPYKTIYYKTDQQTHTGIYSGGKVKPWIYSSDTIRKTALTDTNAQGSSLTCTISDIYTYEFDIHKNELVSDCNIHPTDNYQSDSPWLWARNNKYPNESIDIDKMGKWMLFLPKDAVDWIWNVIKIAVKKGELWQSKVSTSNAKTTHAIMIYTKDYTDVNDVIEVHDYLESSGIKLPYKTIYYKTNQQTQAGFYSGGIVKSWIYSSDTIRKTACTDANAQGRSLTCTTSDIYTYEFDIHKKELVSYCNFYPTEVHQCDSECLCARNNKYSNEIIDPDKIGKWMLFLPKDAVNAIWNLIKIAVKSGELWRSKVSTSDGEIVQTHAIMIYTKDYTDVNDVIKVLDYLESSGIKLPYKTIYYKTGQQTRAGIYSGGKVKPWMYSSDTIRKTVCTDTNAQGRSN